jgi:hypothetical protein
MVEELRSVVSTAAGNWSVPVEQFVLEPVDALRVAAG